MEANGDSNMDDWVVEWKGLNDDPWNLDWGQFFTFDEHQLPQHSGDVLGGCGGRPTLDPGDLLDRRDVVWKETLETNPVLELSQVVFLLRPSNES